MNEIRDLVRSPPGSVLLSQLTSLPSPRTIDGIEYVESEDCDTVSEIHAIISGPGQSYLWPSFSHGDRGNAFLWRQI